VQVLCNGGIAAYLAVFVFIETGCGEHVIDFENQYRSSWLSVAILCKEFLNFTVLSCKFLIYLLSNLGAISCSNGDTWASEFGTVLTQAEPRLVISGEKVPRGTYLVTVINGPFQARLP